MDVKISHEIPIGKANIITKNEYIDWKKFNGEAKRIYNANFGNYMANIPLCASIQCELHHENILDNYYDHICNAMKEETKLYIRNRGTNFKPVPG